MDMEVVGTERQGKGKEMREGRKERERERNREFRSCVPFATIPLIDLIPGETLG